MKIHELVTEKDQDERIEPTFDPAQQLQQPAQPTQPAQPQQQKNTLGNLYNRFKGGIAGARAGYQQSQARNKIANLAQDAFKKWNQQMAGNPEALQDPAELYKFAQRMAPRVENLPAPPDVVTPLNVMNYFNTVTGLALAGPEPDDNNERPLSPNWQKARDQVEQERAKSILSKTLLDPEGTAKDTAAALIKKGFGTPQEKNIEQQALAQGVVIKNNEPIIISTGKGKEYGLDDNGRWIHLASGRVPPQTLQAFLSQQHDISMGINANQAQAQPTQTTQPTPTAQSGIPTNSSRINTGTPIMETDFSALLLQKMTK